jgi:hypothetical protein
MKITNMFNQKSKQEDQLGHRKVENNVTKLQSVYS